MKLQIIITKKRQKRKKQKKKGVGNDKFTQRGMDRRSLELGSQQRHRQRPARFENV